MVRDGKEYLDITVASASWTLLDIRPCLYTPKVQRNSQLPFFCVSLSSCLTSFHSLHGPDNTQSEQRGGVRVRACVCVCERVRHPVL